MTLSPKSVLPILSLSPIFKQKQKFPMTFPVHCARGTKSGKTRWKNYGKLPKCR